MRHGGIFSGAVACLAARAVIKISGAPVIELWNHPKIREKHGIDADNHSLLSSVVFPTERKYFLGSTILDVLLTDASFVFPPLGYAQTAIAPIIYQKNKRIQEGLESMLKEKE